MAWSRWIRCWRLSAKEEFGGTWNPAETRHPLRTTAVKGDQRWPNKLLINCLQKLLSNRSSTSVYSSQLIPSYESSQWQPIFYQQHLSWLMTRELDIYKLIDTLNDLSSHINVIYHFSSVSKSTRATFTISKTEKLVRDWSEKFDSSPLWSVRLRFGFNRIMFGAKFLRAAMDSCLQICIVQ